MGFLFYYHGLKYNQVHLVSLLFWEESLCKSWFGPASLYLHNGLQVRNFSTSYFFLSYFLNKCGQAATLNRYCEELNPQLSLDREMSNHSLIVKAVILHISLATISFISIYATLTFKGDDMVDPDSLPTIFVNFNHMQTETLIPIFITSHQILCSLPL